MRNWIIAGLIILVGISLAVIVVISRDLRECRRDARLELGRQEAQQPQGEHTYLLDEFQIKALKKRGLSDPVSRLSVDLMAHPELIPFKGVLGGTMGFYGPEGITILSPCWVFARFEDGHVMGSCLLEYEISPDTTIHWRLIKAQMDK